MILNTESIEKLLKTQICSKLKEKLVELKLREEESTDTKEKIKIRAMIDLINSVYESECRW